MAAKKGSTKKIGATRVRKSNSDDRAVMKLFNGLMAEKGSFIPAGFAEKVEREITGAGVDAVNRRVALTYLSKPFKEMAEKINDDRDTAIAFASAAACIRKSAGNYMAIAEFMTAAETRIMMALCQRADMQEITALADVESEGAT